MSTILRSKSSTQKPQYKDYVSFVESYRNGRKDDENSLTTSDSGVNLSLSSSVNNSSSTIFSDLSDNIKNHHEPKQTKPMVKSEVFIEIKSPNQYPTQEFRYELVTERQSSVGATAKIFEGNELNNTSTIQRKHSTSRQNSVGELSKKFENSVSINNDPKKRPLKKAESIGKMTRIFENTDRNNKQQNRAVPFKPKNFNASPKPYQNNTNLEAKIVNKPEILSPKPVVSSAPSFPKFTSERPATYADSVDSALSSLSVSPSPPRCASPPPPGCVPQTPPPPPPLPPANFSSKPTSIQKANNIPKQITVQMSNGNSNGSIDKNDPRVKKAVYGALRHMYGAYHDQANDYLATLPKNRVRKNNGLDSIIDTIASQGGLDKLTGRVNPKQDVE
ncbi:hypothetical protein ABEB36_008764 [Hypothenemus hampei]|uniref:WH2 domain-containing protein n=1 Tax=Hypothenemus hampei TaxID=57062 RepID=A0ABD1EQ52_HYPHA